MKSPQKKKGKKKKSLLHRNELQQVGQADGEEETEVYVRVPGVAHAVGESGMNTVQYRTLYSALQYTAFSKLG